MPRRYGGGLEYPLRQVDTGLAAAASQLGLEPGTGHTTASGTAMGSSSASSPGEGPAMQKAREQHGELHTTSRAAPLSAMLLKDQDARGHIAARAEAGPHDVS
jgi:hypothetical protein